MNVIAKLIKNLESSQSRENFSVFLEGKKDLLLDELCQGNVILPTGAFFDYLIDLEERKEILKLLQISKEEADHFYESTFSAVLKFKDDFQEFSKYFSHHIQARGQKIIDLMLLIDLYNYDRELENSGSIFMRLINKVRVYVKRQFINKRHIEHWLYLGVSTFSICLLSTLSFFFAGGMSNLIISTLASFVSFFGGVLFSAILHKKYEFEMTDISGRNLIALKYRALFYSNLAGLDKRESSMKKPVQVVSMDYLTEHEEEKKILELA